jgi:hypothetical protein
MFSFFRQGFRQWARSRTQRAKAPERKLHCEALEDRVLPSASVTSSDFLVNTQKHGVQDQPATASSSNGSFVVVWTDFKRGAHEGNIKAQRFDAAGHRVGGEILVAGGRSPQHNPAVAMDAKGDFIVVWDYEYDPTDTDIHAALFHANGRRNGSEFGVAQSPQREYDPSVAMDARGDFVVSYTYQFSAGDSDIHANLYRANRTLVRTIEVAVTTRNETHSKAAMSADGRFAIAFVRSEDIFVERYSKNGNLLSTTKVAGGRNIQRAPSVAMDKKGNTFVVWQEQVNGNWNIYGRWLNSQGDLGRLLTIQATTAQETQPSVAVDPATDRSVVSYQSQTGSTKSVKVTELSAAGKTIKTMTVDSRLGDPSVSESGKTHRFLVAAESLGAKGADTDGGIFAKFGIL